MSLKDDIKQEISKERAMFGDCTPSMMYKSKFGDVAIPVLIYRLSALIYSLTIWCVYVAPYGETLIYYTNWSYTVLVLYFLMATIVSFTQLPRETNTLLVKKQATAVLDASQELNKKDAEASSNESQTDKEEETIPWYMKIQWVLYNVSLSSSFLVAIIYWGVIFTIVAPDSEPTFYNISTHALNAVFMIVEQYISAIPTRIIHVYHCIIYAIVYVIFSIIVYYAAGIILYPYVLDWSNPGLTVGVVFGLILFYVVAQFALFLIYRALTLCMKNRN